MIKRSIFIFLIASAMVACGPRITDEQMNSLKQLELQLDSTIQDFEQIDSAEAFKAIETYEANLSYLQKEIKDTLPRKTAFFVDSYYQMRKPLRKYAQNYSIVKSELTLSEKQLEDLRRDVENGLVELEQFNDYLAIEQKTVDQLEAVTTDLIMNMNKVMPMYEKKNPRIDSLVKVYKLKQAEGG